MGRHHFIIVAALILAAIAAMAVAMDARKHPPFVTTGPASMGRSAGRSWWLTTRQPWASRKAFYAHGLIKPE